MRRFTRALSPLILLSSLPAAVLSQQPPVYEATIAELQGAMAKGSVTAVQLVDAYLARIRAYDQEGPALNAMIRLNPQAREDAAALDAERARSGPRGPLHGIPIILKDNYDTANLPTSAGSIALAGLVPRADGFVVAKLRAAGAVILGKANMHELAAGITTVSSLGGQTRNAYDPQRCPGGSSGGTGAAIAASFAAVGWGSDTCGSIRIPAAFGSLFGLRPTQGLVSRTGIIPLSHTQDIGGPLTRTVADLAIALDATVGADSADAATAVLAGRVLPRFVDSLRAGALRGARLGVLRRYVDESDQGVAAAIGSALDTMKARGAEIVDVAIADLDSVIAGSRAVDFETKFDLMDYLARVPDAPVRSLSDILARGLYHVSLGSRWRRVDTVSARESAAHRAALAKQGVLRSRLIGVLDSLRLDALVYPTMQREPALIGEAQGGSTCQLSANSGLPALTAPSGFTTNDLPVGIEFLGRPFADARLVALAYAFEQAGPRRRPPSTTPPLVNGRPPAPLRFAVTARTSAAGSAPTARGAFAFDALRNELRYDVRVAGAPAERLEAIVIRRSDGERPGPVLWRLAGPGAAATSGTLMLTAAEAHALMAGQLSLAVFTGDGLGGPAQTRLAPTASRDR